MLTHAHHVLQLYVLTHVEGLQLWDFGAETRLVKVDDIRPSLSQASPGLQIDYCEHICNEQKRLRVVCELLHGRFLVQIQFAGE